MSNFKLVKTAAALALGASVVTSAVATTDASAASKYKIKSGKLVYAKSGKVVKGYVTYKSTVYKNGSKLTGLKGKTYYKAGKKATGTYKGAYYVKGVKKVTTGTYNKAYYVKGVKKVSTGLYASKYYKDGKLATGTYKGAYYVKGLKKVTTGTYNGAYYVAGKKVVSTGLYKDQLYVSGKLNKGYKLYKEDLYKDAVLNKGLVVFEDKLYDGAKLNEGHKIFKDELYNGSELNTKLALFEGKLYDGAKLNEGIKKFEDKWYNNAELADGTFTIDGKEVAIENGVEVGAKVKSVEAINGKQVKVTFNKSVEADSLIATDGTLVNGVLKMEKVAATSPTIDLDAAEAELAEDGRTLTITYDGNEYAEGDYVFSVVKNKVQTTNKATVEYIPAYTSSTINIKDTVAPTLEATKKINATQYKLTFSKPVKGLGAITAKYADGTDLTGTATVTRAVESSAADNNSIIVTLANTTVGKDVNVQIVGITDYSGNIVSPNPVAFTAVAGAKDGIAPTFNVTAESATTLTVKFSEEVQSFNKSEFKIGPSGLVAGDRVIQDEADKTKYTIKLATPLTAGFHNITVAANKFLDLTGEGNVEHASTIQIKADQVAPVLSSSKVVKERDGKEYLYVSFDKDVQLDKLNVAITTAMTGKSVENFVTDNTAKFKTTAGFVSVDGSKKEYKIALSDITDDSGTALKNDVSYTIDLPASAVKTLTGTPNDLQKGAITFVKGSDSAITPLEVAEVKTNQAGYNAAGAGSADALLKNNQVTVKFAQVVDGASATKASNYTIDGAVVKTAELGTDKKTVTLTLEDGKTTYSGARYLTINNVTTASGVALESTFKKAITLNENIAPTVTGAVVKAVDTSAGTATVELTFTEAITTADTTTLAVFVDGVNDTGVTVANTAATNQKTLTVTISLDDVAKLTNKVITLKANGTSNTIVDAAGNTADIGVVTVK